MMHRTAKAALAVAFATTLFACTSMTGESAKRNASDSAITASVKTHLAADHVTSLTSVDVDTVRGTVYLTGIVPDAAAKEQAGRLARRVDGVNSVVNNLKTRSTTAGDSPAY